MGTTQRNHHKNKNLLQDVANTLKYVFRPRGKHLSPAEVIALKKRRDNYNTPNQSNWDKKTYKRRAKNKIAKQSRKMNRV